MTGFDPYYDDYSHPVRHVRWCDCTGCVEMWGEARQRGLPKRKPNQRRKPRRMFIIRSAWQHVPFTEDWVELINTIQHHQVQVRVWMDHYRSTYEHPETTQECLISIE